MKKHFNKFILVLSLLFIVPTCALADSRPFLLVNLPDDSQMIENVEFDDGDFVQTYQLGGGAHITLLRYGNSDITLTSLVESEWPGAYSSSSVELPNLNEATATKFLVEEDNSLLHVLLVTAHAGQDVLVLEAVYPDHLGEEQINDMINTLVSSLSISTSQSSDTLG